MSFFGKKPDPKEQVRDWKSKLRKEQRVIDRQINAIQREEAKVKRSIKEAAKKGQTDVCKILAKEVVQSRRAVSKMYASKAQMNSVMMQMQNQLSTIRMAGSIQKSTEVMHSMQQLVKLPEIQRAMFDLSKEMAKAGLMEEMIEDTLEGVEDDDLEDLADEEVEKVLFELTQGKLGEVEAVPSGLPEDTVVSVEKESDEEEEEEMSARLAQLRS